MGCCEHGKELTSSLKCWEFFWLAEELLAFEERLSSMVWVSKFLFCSSMAPLCWLCNWWDANFSPKANSCFILHSSRMFIITYQLTWFHIPETHNISFNNHEDLKSRKLCMVSFGDCQHATMVAKVPANKVRNSFHSSGVISSNLFDHLQ